MATLNFTKETLDNTNYFATTNVRGTTTTIFQISGTTFVQVNRSPAKALKDIVKISKDAKSLLEVFNA